MYPSDLTDEQWGVIEAALASARATRRGRPVRRGMRAVVNAIMYVVKTGCQWRSLPKEYGPWMSAYSHFRRMRSRGEWDRVLTILREQLRGRAGRNPQPTVAIVDSQSAKTVSKGGSAVLMPARRSKVASATSP